MIKSVVVRTTNESSPNKDLEVVTRKSYKICKSTKCEMPMGNLGKKPLSCLAHSYELKWPEYPSVTCD